MSATRETTAAVLLVSAALQARMLLLVREYAVNVLYYDQWNYYGPMFAGGSVADLFLFQNGPVRQGVGFIVYKYLSELTAWDTRVEGYASSAVVFAALLAALALRRRLFGPLGWWDLCLPPVFLNAALTGAYTFIPNPSHGPFPLLLALLYCLAWNWRHPARHAAVALVNLLLVYTTFGLLVGFITPPLLALEAWRAARKGEEGEGEVRRDSAAAPPLVALALSLLTLASFFVGYRFDPAVDCFHFPHERPLDYMTFAGVMFASFWRVGGLGALAYAGGVALVLATAAVCARHAYMLSTDRAGDRGRSVVILTLAAFSLLFAAGAAAGRVCIGLDEAKSSRYMPYVIPAALALYFQLLSLKGRTRAPLLAAFAAGAALMAAPLLGGGRASLEGTRRGKEDWKRCYVATENVERCDAAAGFSVYPSGVKDPTFKRKLEHLKRNRLNFYSGD